MKRSNSNLSDFSALVDFSNLINSSLELNFTLNNLLLTCMGKLFATKGLVYLLNNNHEFELKLSKGIQKKDKIPTKSFKFSDYADEKKRKFIFNNDAYPLIIELNGTRGLIGLLILGEKLNKEKYSASDRRFLSTIANISATAIENAEAFLQRQEVNKQLSAKVNQLTALFELSKEFSGTLDIQRISKLLIFSLIGQLMVAEFAIVLCEQKNFQILENKFDETELKSALQSCEILHFNEPAEREFLQREFPALSALGIRLVIPMKFKGETKGLILLGKRKNNLDYSKSDIEFASSISGIAIISIENTRMINQVIEKQKMEKELETARSIQKSLLPYSIPKLKNFDIAGASESARQIGGDYYDVIQLDEKRTLIAIGDVSGKGVQAALLMANLQAFLKSISKQNIPIDEATNLINDLVSENTRMGNFITFFWGILNDETREFHYVNAGHNPPILASNGKVEFLKTGGILLGVTKTITPYSSDKVILPPESRLVLFTDGITEAMDNDFNEYGDERLINLVKNFTGTSDKLLKAILEDVRKHAAGREQYDDITCVVITSRGNE
jgi:sigma-B regulation protein RsbU (phosphoserine phosphatase)